MDNEWTVLQTSERLQSPEKTSQQTTCQYYNTDNDDDDDDE